MKRVVYWLGMFLVLAGPVQAMAEDEAMSGVEAAGIEDGNEYMTECTREGVESDLTGDDLDAYVQECMQELSEGRESSD